MNTEEKPDVELNALGAGCLTSCGTSCLTVVIVCILIAVSGVELTRITPDSIPDGIKILGFFLALAGHGFVGYIVARTAKQGKMFHAILYGALMMILGVLSFIFPASKSNGLTLIVWLLTLPMMILGAKRAIDAE